MSIDNMTGVEDDYDEALVWAIEEVINEIHRIKELEAESQEMLYYYLFNEQMMNAYEQYQKDLER
mgnify:FL=1